MEVQLTVVWNWAMCFEVPCAFLRVLDFYTSEKGCLQGQYSSPSADRHSNIAREQVSCGVVAAGDAGQHESIF